MGGGTSGAFPVGDSEHTLCDSGELVPAFLWTLAHLPFPSAGFALCPFAVIIHSHEFNCMLSAVSPPSKSANPGWLGTPDIANPASSFWNTVLCSGAVGGTGGSGDVEAPCCSDPESQVQWKPGRGSPVPPASIMCSGW